MTVEPISRIAPLALVASLSLAACTTADEPALSEADEARLRDEIGELGEVPENPSNAVADDAVAVELGRGLFHDNKLVSESSGLSCAGCHHPAWGWSEDRPLSTKSDGTDTPAHSQVLTNVGYNTSFFWDGRGDSLWGQARGAIAVVHQADARTVVQRLIEVNYFRTRYEELFPDDALPADPWDEDEVPQDFDEAQEALLRHTVNVGKAIEAYERLIVSKDSPFDMWVAGDDDALSEQQKRGAKVFLDAGCIDCHNGPNFTDGWFHDVGVGVPTQSGAAAGVDNAINSRFSIASDEFSDDADWGAARIEELQARYDDDDNLDGAFKTPTLRDVTMRPVFGHLGRVTTLRDWIERYSEGATDNDADGETDPLYEAKNLSDAEIDDLIEFLDALTGDPSSAELSPHVDN